MTVKFQNLARRSEIIRAARSFFHLEGFLEVETPIITPEPLPEANIEAVKTENGFLITSPEVYMKPLLAQGAQKIFQITKCFRKNEHGSRHREEFTMLEWYRAHSDYTKLKEDTIKLIRFIAEVLNTKTIERGDKEIDLFSNWEDIKVDEAYRKFAGHPAPTDDFQFDEEMGRLIEPNLGWNKPTFLSDYPVKYCPMSAACQGDQNLGQRFELYIAGLELANGCTELADWEKQRQNIETEQQRRAQNNMQPYPFPNTFLEAMKTFPPSAGTALGIDRLTMLFTNSPDIQSVLTF